MEKDLDNFMDPDHINYSWNNEPLKPRPGFGFYPDYVWNSLEYLTEVGGRDVAGSQ